MGTPLRIAIDGPAASGKSTLAQRLAAHLGYTYIDTGVMYRAVTWAALRWGISPEDAEALARLAETLELDIQPPTVADGRPYTVIVEGEDVTWELRRPEVDAAVSQVSAHAGVRQALSRRQRQLGLRGRVVMVGRDIGTVVLPEADLKIYLDADLETRARRRYQELRERGQAVSFEEVLEAMRQRDALDQGREVAPLRPAPDAVVLDTTALDIEEVFRKVVALIEARCREDSRVAR
ncbi:MAG: (d)CMP kinase [Thermoflexus hugenholtzii]|jgi:cytidylate kinase|uniref:(d)CMP kinase n=1 Tax=Thermoflexus TaxID=1495649 RepID=UPI001C7537A1|nr:MULTISPECIES: (d)CMP kinase [Thermoflexus]QWK09734.1 MAG: (d)CMP kinase [Thermoflexus hugenholtzii]